MLSAIWSQVEFLVEMGIYHLRGQTLIEGRRSALPRDISKRADTLSALAGDHLQGAQKRVMLHLCQRVSAAAPQRNLAIHGQWMRNDHIGSVAAVSWFKVDPDEPLRLLPIDQLVPLVIEAGAISQTMFSLLHDLGALASIEANTAESMAAPTLKSPPV